MPILDRPNFRRKRPIPSITKVVLLIATVLGFLIHNQCQKNKQNYLIISDVVVENYKSGITEAEVDFTLANNSIRKGSELFMIKLYGQNNELLAKRQIKIYLIPNTKRKYSRIIDKGYTRAPKEKEKLKATVEVYVPKI